MSDTYSKRAVRGRLVPSPAICNCLHIASALRQCYRTLFSMFALAVGSGSQLTKNVVVSAPLIGQIVLSFSAHLGRIVAARHLQGG